jgi:S-adenosylhomocysteine hydrolase
MLEIESGDSKFLTENSQGHSSNLMDQSFSKELAPLLAQANNGLFDKLDDSEDNIDDMIDEYKH